MVDHDFDNDDDNIEGNLLLPYQPSVGSARHAIQQVHRSVCSIANCETQARYIVKIHSADQLFVDPSYASSVKRALIGGDVDPDAIESFVQVAYAGHTVYYRSVCL